MDSADYVRGDLYRQCVESGQAMGAEIDAVEEVLIDLAGVDGMSLADCARALLAQRDALREGVEEAIDLLNTPGGAGEALAALTVLIDGDADA